MITVEVKRNTFNECPKLMIGKNTGTVYLAIDSYLVNGYVQYSTIVLKPTNSDSQSIGDVNQYKAELLDDFFGEVTLKGTF